MYGERGEVALPADLNVNERVFWFLTWQQMAYVAVGLLIGLAVASWIPLNSSQRTLVVVGVIGVSAGAALFRPADRGLVGWIGVLVAFMRDSHYFVWRPDCDFEAEWGISRSPGTAPYRPRISTGRGAPHAPRGTAISSRTRA